MPAGAAWLPVHQASSPSTVENKRGASVLHEAISRFSSLGSAHPLHRRITAKDLPAPLPERLHSNRDSPVSPDPPLQSRERRGRRAVQDRHCSRGELLSGANESGHAAGWSKDAPSRDVSGSEHAVWARCCGRNGKYAKSGTRIDAR